MFMVKKNNLFVFSYNFEGENKEIYSEDQVETPLVTPTVTFMTLANDEGRVFKSRVAAQILSDAIDGTVVEV